MTDPVRPEVLQRLILGKSLLIAGMGACTDQGDRTVFTRGILMLHDAAESVLGAVADHLHVDLKPKHSLLDYYELVKNADAHHRVLPYKTQMRNLNQIRIDAKHLGVLPDPKTNAYLPRTVRDMCTAVCRVYLDVEFELVSLKSLIRDERVRNYIEHAEEDIASGRFETALVLLAHAMFFICDSHRMSILGLRPQGIQQSIEFPNIFSTYHTVDLLGHGVDPYLYYRFKNLTPRIGRSTVDGENLIVWWEKDFGHPGNWTERNARFCFNFCVETALKYQREPDEGYTIIDYATLYEDVIEPAGSEAVFFNRPASGIAFLPQMAEPRREIFVLKKGVTLTGRAWDSEEQQDEWSVISKGLPSLGRLSLGIGFVSKADVVIRRRERKGTATSGRVAPDP